MDITQLFFRTDFRPIQGGALKLAPPLLHSCVVEGMPILVFYPVNKQKANQFIKIFIHLNFQNTKNKTAVKLTAVSCAPVVEVKIKRPDTKYQLGFSVQNGVVS